MARARSRKRARGAAVVLLVAGLVALFFVPTAARGTWGYAVEAVLLTSLMVLIVEQNRHIFRALGKHGVTLLVFLLLLSAAQLIKSKALFPFVSWSMYSARLSDPVVVEYRFEARHKSGRTAEFAPARIMASLAYSRAANGVRNSLNHCFGEQPDDACEREKQRTTDLLQALANYANHKQTSHDPIQDLTVVQRRLAPPYHLDQLHERAVLSIQVPVMQVPGIRAQGGGA
jgi:hypothetical protein